MLCSLTNTRCSRTRAKRCRQYAFTVDFGAPFDAHNFSTHSSSISRARGPHLPNVSTTNGTNTLSAGTTASYFRIFSDSRTFAARPGFGSTLPRIEDDDYLTWSRVELKQQHEI